MFHNLDGNEGAPLPLVRLNARSPIQVSQSASPIIKSGDLQPLTLSEGPSTQPTLAPRCHHSARLLCPPSRSAPSIPNILAKIHQLLHQLGSDGGSHRSAGRGRWVRWGLTFRAKWSATLVAAPLPLGARRNTPSSQPHAARVGYRSPQKAHTR